jgi:hypothetical protein
MAGKREAMEDELVTEKSQRITSPEEDLKEIFFMTDRRTIFCIGQE